MIPLQYNIRLCPFCGGPLHPFGWLNIYYIRFSKILNASDASPDVFLFRYVSGGLCNLHWEEVQAQTAALQPEPDHTNPTSTKGVSMKAPRKRCLVDVSTFVLHRIEWVRSSASRPDQDCFQVCADY